MRFSRRFTSLNLGFGILDEGSPMAKKRCLPEIRVLLERVKKGEQAVSVGYPENLGLRTKLGGKPDWIQSDETPECELCGEPMDFVAQIDSIEHENQRNPLSKPALGHQDYMFGDVGMIYIFFCFDCLQPSCVVQYY
jgi:hypothetical protein